MTLFDWLYKGTGGFLFACFCLLVLVVIAFVYIGKYEKLQAEREDELCKKELSRQMREDRWARVADGLEERDE